LKIRTDYIEEFGEEMEYADRKAMQEEMAEIANGISTMIIVKAEYNMAINQQKAMKKNIDRLFPKHKKNKKPISQNVSLVDQGSIASR